MVKKHLLVVSQYFYPESFRINDMCLEWKKRGYKVTVLTGIPNYPEGKIYEGYEYWKNRKENWKGIEIIRIPLIPRGKNSIGLIANYLSFVCSGFLWKIGTKIKADFVFIFEVSPMTQALVGVWYAKKNKIPCHLYVQDLWPENVEIVTGIHNKYILGSISKMVEYIYNNSTNIFATSQSFVNEIKKHTSLDKKHNVVYLPQYAEDFYKPMKKKIVPEIENDDSFKIIFTGNIGYAQGLEILPKVADHIKQTRLIDERRIKFILVGEGRYKSELLANIKAYQVEEYFKLIQKQSPERIPELLSACDAAFISFSDNNLFAMTIPAKLQSYMACGMPIVAAVRGETKKIIEEAECGLVSDNGDVKQMIENIRILISLSYVELKQLGNNAEIYYRYNFNKNKLMDEIENYFLNSIY